MKTPMGFHNATSYPALDAALTDHAGRQVVVAIVKGTFSVLPDGRVVPAEEPAPIRTNDECVRPDHPHTSLLFASDVCVEKPGTDVVVAGDAISARPVAALDVAVRVGHHTVGLRVHGERVFYAAEGGLRIGPAAPFERMPIVYERAYGGASADGGLVELRNPAGVGVAKRARDLEGQPAPQIEDPAHPHRAPNDDQPPVGLRPIMTHWTPRREHAGTFDEAWKRTRMPLMPRDFDLRHNHVAHPALVFAERLRPGTPIQVLHMSEGGLLQFELPRFPIVFRARRDHTAPVTLPGTIDTVLIHPAERRVEIVARHAFALGRGHAVLREVIVDTEA